MQLQVSYRCDICEEKILIDFKKSLDEKKIVCPHCGVVYEFTEEELKNFGRCYRDFLNKMKQRSQHETV